jgi:hypothetical protein
LFHRDHLQAGVVAARVRAEFVHVAEARVEGLLVSERCEASGTHVLVAVQFDLIGLVDCASANVIDTQSPSRSELSLHSKAPFKEVGCLERACREGDHNPEMLRYLGSQGIGPGTVLKLAERLPFEGGYRVLIAASKKSVLLSEPLASAIFVSV